MNYGASVAGGNDRRAMMAEAVGVNTGRWRVVNKPDCGGKNQTYPVTLTLIRHAEARTRSEYHTQTLTNFYEQSCIKGSIPADTYCERLNLLDTNPALASPRSALCVRRDERVAEGSMKPRYYRGSRGEPDPAPTVGWLACTPSHDRPPTHQAPDAPATSRTETPPPAGTRRAWRRLREVALLLMIMLLASPVSGRFDRGGPQHSITWGRGNSPSSAVFASPPSNVTAVRGHRARLPCQVKNLGHKDVSWIRQRDLHILTVGIFTYTTDDRFKVHHTPETEDWHLDISSVTFRDSGVYECQVSTSPKVSLPITLSVLGQQKAVIRGPGEVYVQRGSTISLECAVRAGVQAVGLVRWYRGHNPLNYSSPRGGISMEVEKTPTLTTSRLHITRAARADSGNYTCHPKLAQPSSVTVHVVSAGEESAAAVQSVCVGARAYAALVWACVGGVWAALFLATRLHPPS